jgi:hypothetical protein
MAIAMQFGISDRAAARFPGMFYASLMEGDPVERALTVARRYMHIGAYLEWGVPVLFTRSGSCVLVDVQHKAENAAASTLVAIPQSKQISKAQEELRQLYM